MCSGRVSPHFIIKAFQEGADGVLVAGCPEGDCHYSKGNYLTRKRVIIMQELLSFIGFNPKRLEVKLFGAPEADTFQKVAIEFTETVKTLGPSPLKRIVENV
jgi:F420-non-reducing hydrogenase iron-sulfur subunit